MTSRERLLTAYRCQEPDGVPIMVRGVHAWDEDWTASQHPSYKPVIEAVDEYCDYQVGWGPGDIVVSPGDRDRYSSTINKGDDWDEVITTLDTPKGPLVSRYLNSNRGLPGMEMEHYVKTLEDVERILSIPFDASGVDYSGFFERDRQIGDHGLVLGWVNTPIFMVGPLLGSELLALWSIDHRDVILNLLYTFLERSCELLDQQLAAGVGPLYQTA